MIIANASWKGGTGKTTLAAYEAVTLAEKGKKVLVIDLDPNCAISQVFNVLFKDFSSLEFLTGTWEEFKGVYPAGQNIDIIPGNLSNGLLNNIMDGSLKNALKRSGLLGNYDFVVIDPPGYWGVHTRNAVFAAELLIIPGTCSRIDFEASKLFFKTLQQCCIESDTFVCVNAFSEKTNLPGIYEEYQKHFGEFLFPESVPYIKSLKRLTNDINNYALQPSVKKRLDFIIQGIFNAGGNNA